MTAVFQLRILDEEKNEVFASEYNQRVDVGRQDRGEPGPFNSRLLLDCWRLVIAPLSEDTVPRHFLSLEPLIDNRFRIRNDSKTTPLRLISGDEVRPGEVREIAMPAQLMVGRRTIRVDAIGSLASEPQELPEKTIAPGAFDAGITRMAGMALPLSSGDKGTIRWLKAVMDVFQAAASSSDFFAKAALAAAEMIGLDSTSVWLIHDGEWIEQTRQSPNHGVNPVRPTASRSVLNRVKDRGKTIWNTFNDDSSVTQSAPMLSAVVAAPILNREGVIIGALYGDRSVVSPLGRNRPEISEVQAMLVELLAEGIAAGIDRLRREQEMLAERIRFEQFFTPELALHLERNPDLLKGRESEVTLLFCDIRGFSRISEKLGPAMTVEWINDVMGHLSESVLAFQGVLVDYIGDELMAMWGAPSDQPDHATLACRAALEIIAKLPALSASWEKTLGEPLDLGIGLNTGTARVGNTGTTRKFKYGPLGNTVNLASRVQGATKHFKTRLIITGGTRAALNDEFRTRRLGKVRVINIAEPVELYELGPVDGAGWARMQSQYESALDLFESGKLGPAAQVLSSLQTEYSSDGPSLLLLSRAVNALCDPETYDQIWTLASK